MNHRTTPVNGDANPTACPSWCDPESHEPVNGEHCSASVTLATDATGRDVAAMLLQEPGAPVRVALGVAEAPGGPELAEVVLTLDQAEHVLSTFGALLAAARSR